MGRYGGIWGDSAPPEAERLVQVQGDIGRYREIWGDEGRYGEILGAPPEAERLVQVQHRDVREVRHARHRLQEEEALDHGPLLEDQVDELAQVHVLG